MKVNCANLLISRALIEFEKKQKCKLFILKTLFQFHKQELTIELESIESFITRMISLPGHRKSIQRCF